MLLKLIDGRLIFNTGYHFSFSTALRADRRIDLEHPLQALRPDHGLVTLLLL
jgi:hypothetical protein